MAYKITKDLISDIQIGEVSQVGTGRYRKIATDESGAPIRDSEGNRVYSYIKPDSEMPHEFRLKDDDGIIYFYGIADDASSERAFIPLDNTGGHYGCTIIEYKNPTTNAWEML